MSLSSIIINDGLRDIQNKTNPYGVARRLITMIIQYRIYDSKADLVHAGYIPDYIHRNEHYVLLEAAIKSNNKYLCEHFLLRSVFPVTGLYIASKYNNKELIDLFISKGADSWIVGAEGAAEGGHKDLIDWYVDKILVNKKSVYWPFILQGAAKGEHKELIEYCIHKGNISPNSMKNGLHYAIKKDNLDLVKYFINLRVNYKDYLNLAIMENSYKVFVYLLSIGVRCLEFDIRQLIKYENKEMITYVYEKLHYDVNLGLKESVICRNMEYIEYFIEKGANNWNDCLFEAIELNSIELVDYFINKGANDLHYARDRAINSRYRKLADHILQKIREIV